MQNFAAEIVGNLTVDATHARIAAEVFSSGFKILFDFASEGYSQANIVSALLNAHYPAGATATATALKQVVTKFFVPTDPDTGVSSGWRLGAVPMVVIVITDGGSTEPGNEVEYWANQIRAVGANIIAIGVGSLVNTTQLDQIAGTPDQVVLVKDESSLESIIQNFIQQFPCQGPQKGAFADDI